MRTLMLAALVALSVAASARADVPFKPQGDPHDYSSYRPAG